MLHFPRVSTRPFEPDVQPQTWVPFRLDLQSDEPYAIENYTKLTSVTFEGHGLAVMELYSMLSRVFVQGERTFNVATMIAPGNTIKFQGMRTVLTGLAGYNAAQDLTQLEDLTQLGKDFGVKTPLVQETGDAVLAFKHRARVPHVSGFTNVKSLTLYSSDPTVEVGEARVRTGLADVTDLFERRGNTLTAKSEFGLGLPAGGGFYVEAPDLHAMEWSGDYLVYLAMADLNRHALVPGRLS